MLLVYLANGIIVYGINGTWYIVPLVYVFMYGLWYVVYGIFSICMVYGIMV